MLSSPEQQVYGPSTAPSAVGEPASWWRRRSAAGGRACTRWSSSWSVSVCPGSSSSRLWPSPETTEESVDHRRRIISVIQKLNVQLFESHITYQKSQDRQRMVSFGPSKGLAVTCSALLYSTHFLSSWSAPLSETPLDIWLDHLSSTETANRGGCSVHQQWIKAKHFTVEWPLGLVFTCKLSHTSLLSARIR